MKPGIRPKNGPFIPVSEILIRASRSSGPGGQHANVTASKIEAVFEVESSMVLNPAQKSRIARKAGPVITAVSQDARSQARNRDLALDRLESKLADALAVPKRRRPTRPTRSSKQRRLTGKKIRSETKKNRRPPSHDD
ncbi:MAG: alternative ribosome rescue aminoacyl-tRNA hydrolase ArfB [Solirubrobacterales bacterium]